MKKYASIIAPLLSTGRALFATTDTGPANMMRISSAIRTYKELPGFRFSMRKVEGGILIKKTGVFAAPLFPPRIIAHVLVPPVPVPAPPEAASFDARLADLEDDLRRDLEAVGIVRKLLRNRSRD